MKANRTHNRSSSSYSTKSNKNRIIKTPGNRLTVIKVRKKKSQRICPITKHKINGITLQGSRRDYNLSKKNKTVSRAYGGHLSAQALKKNISKAFLLEEKKLAQKVFILKKKNTKETENNIE